MNRERLLQVSIFLLRVVAGLILLQAGGLKLFGWFGGMPGGGALPPLILVAGILEVGGGIAMMLGLLTRPVAFILSGEMAVAYFMGHFSAGFWPIQNHGEPAVLLCFIFLFFAAHGAGSMSIDAVLNNRKK